MKIFNVTGNVVEGLPTTISSLTDDYFGVSSSNTGTDYAECASESLSKAARIVYVYARSGAYDYGRYFLLPGIGYINNSGSIGKNSASQIDLSILTNGNLRIEYSNNYKTIKFYKQNCGYIASGKIYYYIYG